jgi:hypothetical protein
LEKIESPTVTKQHKGGNVAQHRRQLASRTEAKHLLGLCTVPVANRSTYLLE